MIKLINIITQIIIVLGCCAILIFTLSIAIAFAKNDFATITNIYDYIYMLNVSMKLNHITFTVLQLLKCNIKYKSIWEMNDSGALLLLSNYQYTYQYY